MNDILFLRDIRGQDHALGMIRRAGASKRMAHAYLFRGPRGVGKRSTAMAFARFLLCREAADADACGQCVSCRKAASGNHPDIQTIVPEGAAIKIEQIRAMQRYLAFPPLEGELRVTIIIRAQSMAAVAANSLLKILEEPPPGNLIILTAEDNAPILPTIISRCQVLGFNNLSQTEVSQILAGEEEFDTTAIALARLSAGSPGLALKSADNGIPQLQERVTVMLIHARQKEPIINEALALAEDCAALKDDLPIFLQGVYAWLVDLAWHASGEGQRGFAADLSAEEMELSRAIKVRGIHQRMEQVKQARTRLRRKCNPRAVCELLLLRLTYPDA